MTGEWGGQHREADRSREGCVGLRQFQPLRIVGIPEEYETLLTVGRAPPRCLLQLVLLCICISRGHDDWCEILALEVLK